MLAITNTCVVNDIQSRLNRTVVAGIAQPGDIGELQQVVRDAAGAGQSISICGARHAMGGQQLGAGNLLIDMTGLSGVVSFDARRGLIEMQAGANWLDVLAATETLSYGRWAIRQKQSGCDTLTLGGAVSANVHGRGLTMGPIVDDIESLKLIDAEGELVECSRTANPQLFSLVVGGYGLFGVVATVTLRLMPRLKVRRIVEICDIEDAMAALPSHVADGSLYGDFQCAIDPADECFLRRGIFTCYAPVSSDVEVTQDGIALSDSDWASLLKLALTDKREAFHRYATHYRATDGQIYFSDVAQLSAYFNEFASLPDESLIIGEHYVPPDALTDFLRAAREIVRNSGAEVIYANFRWITRDTTTFLPWAQRDYACVVFNLRTPHTPAGIQRTGDAFRALTDASIARSGSFYLTYHRFAMRDQIDAAYPRFEEFLAQKRQHDPGEVFTSDWYRHYAGLPAAFLETSPIRGTVARA